MTPADDYWSPRYPDEDELARAVDGSAALRQLLAAASAPASPAELRGRSRAIAEFRAARRPRGSAPEPDLEFPSRARDSKLAAPGLSRLGRWPARLTVACTALAVLLQGAASATAGELPTALRNAVSHLVVHRRRLPPLVKLISALPNRTAASHLMASWGRPARP
jgi:hypothetical protein